LSDVEKREQYDRLGFFVPESHNGADNAKPIPRSTEGFGKPSVMSLGPCWKALLIHSSRFD